LDNLKEILHTLSPEEQKELATFIGRQKDKKHRKDLHLYKLLLQKRNAGTADILKVLYPAKENPVAYHALRKRLFGHLTDYILLKRQESDPTAGAAIRGMISLAGYLFEKGAAYNGWKVLRKAEKTATDSEHYDLLNSVYVLQTEQAHHPEADLLPDIVEKYQRNKIRAEEEERASIACSWINYYLQEAKVRGNDLPFEGITRRVLEDYQLAEVVADRPRLFYQLMHIARSAVLVKKDYYAFGSYLIGQYTGMEERGAFLPLHLPYQTGLLYMIAQTLYRNRRFDQSLQWLIKMEALLQLSGKREQQQWTSRHTLLLAMNYVYTGQNEKATAILEKIIDHPPDYFQPAQLMNARINLAFCYFQRSEFGKAGRLLLSAGHSDLWCGRKLGREWVLKKNLSELIIHYETGNPDLAINKIRSIERSFGDLLRSPGYRNVEVYLHFLRQLLENPGSLAGDAFSAEADKQFHFLPVEQEDLQAISFYAWLKAKTTRREYYPVLLELVKM
jgi:tetratricopeptide (TPR) repeat protein